MKPRRRYFLPLPPKRGVANYCSLRQTFFHQGPFWKNGKNQETGSNPCESRIYFCQRSIRRNLDKFKKCRASPSRRWGGWRFCHLSEFVQIWIWKNLAARKCGDLRAKPYLGFAGGNLSISFLDRLGKSSSAGGSTSTSSPVLPVGFQTLGGRPRPPAATSA